MITINRYDITTHYGDTFLVRFDFGLYKLQQADVIVFSVKRTPESTDILLQQEIINPGETYVNVEFSAEAFKALEAGQYTYDLLYKNADRRITIVPPSILHIKGVAHSG